MPSLLFIHPFIYRFSRGIERYTLSLSSALVRNGLQVGVLTWRNPSPVSWTEVNNRVRIYSFPLPRFYQADFVVIFYIAHFFRHTYDMIFINFADYGEAKTINLFHRFGYKLPYSIVFHYPYSQVPHRYESFVRSGLVNHAQKLVAVSDIVAREALAFLGQECQVIPNGVDTDRFRKDNNKRVIMRRKLGFLDEAPILLTVSALEERKGIQWVIKALPLILKQIPNLNYLIVGDGPYRTDLEKIVSELSLDSKVHFLPSRPDVSGFYQVADLFVILSKGEASSLVSFEAMACQLPIITSSHSPFNEFITSKWGYQVDEKDNHELAEVVFTLFSDSELRKKLGKAGRDYVLQHHTWEKVASQYIKLLG